MSEWLEEIETLESICESTIDCKDCELGYCIKPKETKTEENK